MTSLRQAREIMGANMFGLREAAIHFGLNPSTKQVLAFPKVPWNEETLESCKDTHIFVAVFPLSILDIRDIARKVVDQTLFYNEVWYDSRAFAKNKSDVGWQLVRKSAAANSTSKTWNEV